MSSSCFLTSLRWEGERSPAAARGGLRSVADAETSKRNPVQLEAEKLFRMYRSRKYFEVERGGKEKLLFENRLRKFEFRTNCGT